MKIGFIGLGNMGAIQDGDGNFFKLKMKALKNDAGERGYPVFEYELLK